MEIECVIQYQVHNELMCSTDRTELYGCMADIKGLGKTFCGFLVFKTE